LARYVASMVLALALDRPGTLNFFKEACASLSMVCNSGGRPLAVSSSYSTVYALIASASDLFFIGSANIVFVSKLYKTSIYLYPRIETDG
jgi:hypothetical protein